MPSGHPPGRRRYESQVRLPLWTALSRKYGCIFGPLASAVLCGLRLLKDLREVKPFTAKDAKSAESEHHRAKSFVDKLVGLPHTRPVRIAGCGRAAATLAVRNRL